MSLFHFTSATKRAVVTLVVIIVILIVVKIASVMQGQSQQMALLEARVSALEAARTVANAHSLPPRPAAAPTPAVGRGSRASESRSPKPTRRSETDVTPSANKDSHHGLAETSRPVAPPAADDGEGGNYDFPNDFLPKFRDPQFVDLNTADSATLVRIPGIGAATVRAILRYRTRLGGYVSPAQVGEAVRWADTAQVAEWCRSWLIADTAHLSQLSVNTADFRTLNNHPYLSYNQVCAIMDLRRRNGRVRTIDELWGLRDFSDSDIERLRPYLSFR